MKPFNFKKFVLSVSLVFLTVGFALSYFREPTREEKVLKALNYDMRFTDKVATNKTRIPSNDQNVISSEVESATKKEVLDLLGTLQLSDEEYGTFKVVQKILVIKDPDSDIKALALLNFEEYYFFSENIDLPEKEKLKSFKVVFDPAAEKFGFLTGTLEIKLKDISNKDEVYHEYNLEPVKEFLSIKTLFARPVNTDELTQINSRMESDGRIDHFQSEIIQRFPKKQ